MGQALTHAQKILIIYYLEFKFSTLSIPACVDNWFRTQQRRKDKVKSRVKQLLLECHGIPELPQISENKLIITTLN